MSDVPEEELPVISESLESDRLSAAGSSIEPSVDVVPASVSGWREIAMMAESAENRLLVPVTLRGLSDCLALIDTGADSSFICSSLASRLDLPVVGVDNMQVRGFGADNLTGIIGVCHEPFLFHGRVVTSVPLYVIDSDLLTNFSLLLGTDFLSANSMTVDLKRKRITQQYSDGSSF